MIYACFAVSNCRLGHYMLEFPYRHKKCINSVIIISTFWQKNGGMRLWITKWTFKRVELSSDVALLSSVLMIYLLLL